MGSPNNGPFGIRKQRTGSSEMLSSSQRITSTTLQRDGRRTSSTRKSMMSRKRWKELLVPANPAYDV